MKSFNTYYESFNQLKVFIETNSIVDNDKLLIQIFTAMAEKEKIKILLQEMATLLPSASLIGSNTDGEICSGKVSVGKTVISFTQFEKTKLRTALVENRIDCYQTGQVLGDRLLTPYTKLLITFTDGLKCNGEDYLRGISSAGQEIIVAGGMAGDNAHFSETYVFTNNQITSHGAVGVALANPDLLVHTDYSFNWLSIGRRMRITKFDKNRIYTIDGLSAYEVYKKYLGSDIAEKLPAVGIEFPLIIHRESESIARAVLVNHHDGSLSFGGNFKIGDYVTFGYGDAGMILNQSIETYQDMTTKAVEAIFIYSCMARRRFMPNLIESEIKPFEDLATVTGFFTHGEFYTHKQNIVLLNQTMTIVGISESPYSVGIKKKISAEKIPLNDYQKSISALSHLLNVTTRELAEENSILEVQKESLHLAQEIGHYGSWEMDPNSGVIICSKESYHIYRLDPQTTHPSFDIFINMVIKEDRSKVILALKSLKDGEINRIEVRAIRADGVMITLLMNGKMLFDKNHKPSKIIGTTIDITELVTTQLKQRQQAQILEQIHDSVISTDLDNIIIHWNHGASFIHGYTAEEMIGESIEKLYPPEDLPKAQQMRKEVLELGAFQGQIRKVTKTGSVIYTNVSLSVLKDEAGKAIGITRYSQDITQEKEIEEQLNAQTKLLNRQAYYDPLTTLPNRSLFDDRLQQSIINAERNRQKFGLLFIDLDNFKQINDTLGHHYGDEVLKIVAKRLSACIGKEDSLARLGGDEFTILVQELGKSESIPEVAQKIIAVMKPIIIIENHEFHISASIGISLYPQDSVLKNDLLKYADTAMYKAKDKGRNTYQFYSAEMTQLAFEKALMERRLHQAIEKQEFVVYYQPQIDVRDESLIGMEALVRWQHPEMGLITPDKFIPLAEETGVIKEMDTVVMRRAMEDISQWYSEGLNPGVLSLNLSIKQMMAIDFLETLEATMKETSFDVKWLELEITESQMMSDPVKSIAILQKVNEMGIEIAIDDFGTGYSSLAYLKRLPVDKLKIDRSFIKDLPHNDEDRAITKAVIALAQSLKLTIIAEGVEKREQLDYLKSNGCHVIQGYYYSKAIAKDEMETYIKKASLRKFTQNAKRVL